MTMWFCVSQFKEEARRGFAGLEEPLAGLLAMLEGSGDWKGKGHSLGYCIVTELQLWMKEHPAAQQVRERTRERRERTTDCNVPQVSPSSVLSIVQ